VTPLFPELKPSSASATRRRGADFGLHARLRGFGFRARRALRPARRAAVCSRRSGVRGANFALLLSLDYAGFLACRMLAGLCHRRHRLGAVALTADAVPYSKRGRALTVVARRRLRGARDRHAARRGARGRSRRALDADLGVLGALAAAGGGHDRAARPGPTGRSRSRARSSDVARAVRSSRGARDPVHDVPFTASSFAVMTSFADACKDRFGSDLSQRETSSCGRLGAFLPGAFLAGALSDRVGKRKR